MVCRKLSHTIFCDGKNGGIYGQRIQVPVIYRFSKGSMQSASGLVCISDRPDRKGLHHLLWEIVDNAVDEAANGFADRINVTLHAKITALPSRTTAVASPSGCIRNLRCPASRSCSPNCMRAANSITTHIHTQAGFTAWARPSSTPSHGRSASPSIRAARSMNSIIRAICAKAARSKAAAAHPNSRPSEQPRTTAPRSRFCRTTAFSTPFR